MAIAGYTNAGKSSLLNRLTGAERAGGQFAVRHPRPGRPPGPHPAGRAFTLTDTVGFVRHLPHQLVEAFRSTLEEVADADLILHVVDGSDADPRAQIAAVREVLARSARREVPELVVINKADAADPIVLDGLRRDEPGALVVSAQTGAGLAELIAVLERAAAAAGPRRSPSWCRTTGVTWSPGCTRRARCSASSTASRAPS